MPTSQDPAAERRRVGGELRRHRISTGRTAGAVARELNVPVSGIVAAEGGLRVPSDVTALLRGYGVTDPDTVAEVSAAVAQLRDDRWAGFAGITNPETVAYFSYEASAAVIRWYEPLWVPGLLQIPDYTRALLKGLYGYSDETIEQCIESRRERQARLFSDDAPEALFLVDEAALRRQVGSADIHRRQLRSLRQTAARTRVSIRAVPIVAGAYPELFAPFVLLEFMSAGEPDVLYLEHPTTATLSRDVRAVCDHLDRFDRIAAAADDELLGRIAGED